MKKNQKSNIVQFPKLKERLIERGMDALKEKQFHQALQLFSDAKKLDDEKEEIHLGLAISLMELGELKEARDICKNMLHQDIGNYFTVLQIYLTILIQLREYHEVQTTIEAVLEENQIPPESAEHFYKLLDFARKMNQGIEETEEEFVETDEYQIEKLLNDPNEQLAYIHSLKDRNIVKHLGILQTILMDPQSHPVIKSSILQLMNENEIQKEISISKFGETISVIPNELELPLENQLASRVISILDNLLGNENPTLFEMVKELWIRHLFVLFPLVPTPQNPAVWAASLHKVGYEMHGIEINERELAELYQVSFTEMEAACRRIYELEEISYLQL